MIAIPALKESCTMGLMLIVIRCEALRFGSMWSDMALLEVKGTY